MESLLLLSLASWFPIIAASGTSPSSPSYVPDPSGRGTVGLIWSCILTLWPCVWTAIHLHMPRRDSKWHQKFLKKLAYAALTLVFPELMLSLAVMQFTSAWRFSKAMNAIIASQKDQIAAREDTQGKEGHLGCPASSITSETKFERWNLTTAFFGIMGGFQVKFKDGSEVPKDTEGLSKVNLVPELLILLAKGKMLPPVERRVCKERGKSDELGKLFVLGQVVWFGLQCIARKASGLPVTLLEINTAVHVVCAIGIYTLMWFKPQGASEPIVIDVSKCTTCERFVKDNIRLVHSSADNLEAYWHDDFDSDDGLLKITFILLGIVYGGLHAVAWDAHFPSYAEQIMWRVSVLLILVLSGFYLFVFSNAFVDRMQAAGNSSFAIIVVLGLGLFFGPRLYLVVEAFTSVRSLPVGAYETVNWVEFLPHIG